MNECIIQTDKGIMLSVRVTPNAKRSAIDGLWNGMSVRIFLNAPAVDGKANEALVDFLSDVWHIKRKNITIVSGHTARNKILLITETEKYEWLKQKLSMENK